MPRRWNPGTLFAALLVAEAIAFVLVAKATGFGPALALTALTSLLGCIRLRRIGAAALAGLRGMVGGGAAREDAVVDGAVGALGAVLLILPGFLTDFIGLALSAPSGRNWVKARLGLAGAVPRRPRPTGTIDLPADDWKRLDTPYRG